MRHNWEITKNWQFIFIALGIIALLACAYFISVRLIPPFFEEVAFEYAFTLILTFILAWVLYKITMWLFSKLKDRWAVTYRWELIAIFLVFAITGSLSARISGPFIELLGITKESLSAWVFWPLRILIIFPIYQVLLVCMGWLFGQFAFFWSFEKKMLARFGLRL